MEIYEIKTKIVEVWAAARMIVQKYGHMKKFAKHIVALVIKQNENLRDIKLAEFLEKIRLAKSLVIGRNQTQRHSPRLGNVWIRR